MSEVERIIAWLRERAVNHDNGLVSVIYAGLADLIERGDFRDGSK